MMIRIYPWDQEGKSLAGRLGSPSVVGDRNLHGGAAASSDLLPTSAQGLPRYAYVAFPWPVPAVFSRQVLETCCLVGCRSHRELSLRLGDVMP